MRALGILPLASMAVVGVIVGFRLLAQGRRTGEQPELLIGLGLVLVAVVGAPLAGVGRVPGLALTPIGNASFACGLAAVQYGLALLSVFTWLVFRRDSFAATLLLVAVVAALGAEWLGIVRAAASGSTLAEVLPRTRPWGISIVATVALVFAWTGCESLVRYQKLRRRLAFGLADAVTANRILLWAIGGFATALLCAAIAACMAAGLPPLQHPLPLAAIALASLAASGCWTLAFLPSPSYLAAIRARSGVRN